MPELSAAACGTEPTGVKHNKSAVNIAMPLIFLFLFALVIFVPSFQFIFY